MFQKFALTSPCEQKSELPSVIQIGTFSKDKVSIPVLMPIDILNGLCFETNSMTQDGALKQMQYIEIDLIKQLLPACIQLSFVDIGLNTYFPLLHSLKLPNIKFITTREALKAELNYLFEKARYISTQCLNAEFTNLKEYNNSASYKEVYNFLFIANFPKDFHIEEINAISEIINEGAKCGIQIIMNLDRSHYPEINSYNRKQYDRLYKLLNEITYINCTKQYAEIRNFNISIINKWFTKYQFYFDTYSTKEIQEFVKTLKKTHTTPNNQVDNFLSVPIGQYGRDRIYFEMGQKAGVYHGLIAGQSGSGKSTLLNNIITTIAEKYSPDEFRLYLLDYKLGVEFKIYKDHPNVEFLLLDNNRLSAAIDALKMLENEMQKREILFEEDLTIQDIEVYNKKAKHKLPRILIIIDEVQQLFKDFATQRQINPLIKHIAKQGRAFGIHMLFSSQSYDGCNINSDILAQMSLRIAYTLASGHECRAILGGDNDIPKALPHYTAVYNTKNGNKDNNIIVKMDYFDRDKILPILKTAAKRYSNCKPFEKTIITRNSVISDNNDSHKKMNSDEIWD